VEYGAASGLLFLAFLSTALFISPVFLPPKDVGICGDLVPSKPGLVNNLPEKFRDTGKSPPIPLNTLEVNKA
jgi:hypothetical protein